MIVIVVVLIALAAVMAARRRRTMALRERFGPGLTPPWGADHAEAQRSAEADSGGRSSAPGLDTKPLSEAARVRYTEEWRATPALFVDQPEEGTMWGLTW